MKRHLWRHLRRLSKRRTSDVTGVTSRVTTASTLILKSWKRFSRIEDHFTISSSAKVFFSLPSKILETKIKKPFYVKGNLFIQMLLHWPKKCWRKGYDGPRTFLAPKLLIHRHLCGGHFWSDLNTFNNSCWQLFSNGLIVTHLMLADIHTSVPSWWRSLFEMGLSKPFPKASLSGAKCR